MASSDPHVCQQVALGLHGATGCSSKSPPKGSTLPGLPRVRSHSRVARRRWLSSDRTGAPKGPVVQIARLHFGVQIRTATRAEDEKRLSPGWG